MNAPTLPSRWLALVLASLLSLDTWTSPAQAATPEATPRVASAVAPATLVGGYFDNVLGNRSKMIQFTCIGFAIGVAILMTATRKH